MVVAASRYVAEDACDRIRVELRATPGGGRHRGGPGGRPPRARRRARQRGGASWCRRSATRGPRSPPRHTRLGSTSRSSAAPSMPLEGKGVHARWDADDAVLRVHTSTQTSTSVRRRSRPSSACRSTRVEVVTPDVGGGFGVKIVHPWPRRCSSRGRPDRLGPAGASGSRTGASTSSPPRTSAARCTTSGRLRRRGPLLGLSTCTFWHDNGAYTPYGIIVPIITSTQLVGPYKPGRLPGRVPLALHEHRDRHAVPGAGRPQACFVMERVMDAIADDLGLDRAEVRLRTSSARRDALRPRADLPGRPAADLRLRRLPGVAGEAQGAGRLGRLRRRSASEARAEGRRVGIGLACYVEGTGVGPYEGAHVQVETDGSDVVAPA